MSQVLVSTSCWGLLKKLGVSYSSTKTMFVINSNTNRMHTLLIQEQK